MKKKCKLLNYGHPITSEQLAQLRKLGYDCEVIDIYTKFDNKIPFKYQLHSLMVEVDDVIDWSEDFILNLPPMSIIAVGVWHEITKRTGKLLPVMRLMRVGEYVSRFEVAEIMNFE